MSLLEARRMKGVFKTFIVSSNHTFQGNHRQVPVEVLILTESHDLADLRCIISVSKNRVTINCRYMNVDVDITYLI